MIKLGYSLSEIEHKYPVKQRIEMVLAVEKFAVELSYITVDRFDEILDEKDIENIKKFGYISIHAPVVMAEDDKTWIRYPSERGKLMVDKLLDIAKSVNADTILFHPDLVDDFAWLNEKVGKYLAFENMDGRKPFGQTIEEMKIAFQKAPNAKWVCDVNHIYTLDKTMELAKEFHDTFKERLCHYHLSGYGGFHNALFISQEDIILQGLKDLNVPIIDEGCALRNGMDSLLKENEYILERLN